MADDKVEVELVAKVDELQEGLGRARDELGRFCKSAKDSLDDAAKGAHESSAGIREDLEHIVESAKGMAENLEKLLKGGEFALFANVAHEAMEKVAKAFEATVGAAEEFGLQNAKFASVMGTSTEHAAGLAAALENVGSSTDAYESIALRLQHTLETSSTISDNLKDKFRDQNGEFLSGTALMDKLHEVTESYAEGADRTSVVVELLGKRSKDYYDISRATSEAAEHQADIFRSLNADIEDTTEASRALEDVEGDVKTEFKAAAIAIGQDLMPAVREFLEYVRDHKTALEDFEVVVKALTSAFFALATAIEIAWDVIKGSSLKEVEDDYLAFEKRMDAMWDRVANKSRSGGGPVKFEGSGETEYDELQRAALRSHKTATSHKGGAAGGAGKDNSSDEEINSEKAIALEKISIEEATNQHLLAMGAESVEQFVAQQRTIENEKYTVKVDALEKELALPDRTKAQIQKTNDEIKLAFEQHVDELVKIAQDYESRKAAVAKEALATAKRADDERLADGKANLDQEAAAGKISALDRDERELALTQQVRTQQIARLTSAMAALDPESKAYHDLVDEKLKLEQNLAKEIDKINAKRIADMKADVTEGIAPLAAGFKTAISDMIENGKTFADTMKDVAKSIESGFISLCEKLIEEWAVKEITNALLTQTTQAASGLAQVESEAAIAGAAAYASTAAIPIVGLAAAPAAAGAAYATVMATYAPLATAAGGMTLDRDQLVYAHAQEMVLPAHLSQGIQAMISSGGAGAGGGDTHLHYSPTVNGQTPDLGELLRTQPGPMKAWLAQMSRDGAFRSRL
jgi:hypothetical protein